MLELLVNEDKEAAQELFHEIVVEKSRDIYESLLEADEEVDESDDEEVDGDEEHHVEVKKLVEDPDPSHKTVTDGGEIEASTISA